MSMMVNPFRFGGGGSFNPASWRADFDNVPTTTDSSWSNYTARNLVSRFLLRPELSAFRVTIQAPVGNPISVADVFVGKSNSMIYPSAPARVTFSGANGFTLAAGASITSDVVNLSFDGATDVAVSIYYNTLAGHNGTITRLTGTYPFLDSGYKSGNAANQVGGLFSAFNEGAYGYVKLESAEPASLSGWSSALSLAPARRSDSWNGYTFRNRYDVGVLNITKAKLRALHYGSLTDLFIGNAEAAAGSLNFLAAPTRLTFGGANGTSSSDVFSHTTDEFLASVLDLSKPVLISGYNNTITMGDGAALAGVTSGYASGNTASATGAWTHTAIPGNKSLGILRIDQKD
ncbi:MAG: hypothetical protein E6R03_12830 [Hyphomicrobiaceae bacterium]|nr:MAG: hypothetical protein E6R03_12830 [Hyphomicrobiaceae bacterium]